MPDQPRPVDRVRLEADLTAFYDQEAADRQTRPLTSDRVALRDDFVAVCREERRRHVLEVGAGPGHDAVAMLAAGLDVTAVDLSAAHVAMCAAAGVPAQVASVLELPFADGSFQAGWTMSTLLHVPDAEFGVAVGELCRVLVPGSPLAIGMWAGADTEGVAPGDRYDPPRFFRFRSDATLRRLLTGYGDVERFESWLPAGDTLRYHWCLLRTPS